MALLSYTPKRIGERKRIPGRSFGRGSLDFRAKPVEINTCPSCGGAFLHYRQCVMFSGVDAMVLRMEAARVAQSKVRL